MSKPRGQTSGGEGTITRMGHGVGSNGGILLSEDFGVVRIVQTDWANSEPKFR